MVLTKPIQIEWSNQSWYLSTKLLSQQAEHVAVLINAKDDFRLLKTLVVVVFYDHGSSLDYFGSNLGLRALRLAN